jgi:hypothetical protein
MGALGMYGLHKRYIELLKLATASGVSEEQARLHLLAADVVRKQLDAEINDFGKYTPKT